MILWFQDLRNINEIYSMIWNDLGFTGDRCQLQLEQCDSNPCQNDALCFVVDDSYLCYCVPDYHGPHCEYRYNDCLLPPFPKYVN